MAQSDVYYKEFRNEEINTQSLFSAVRENSKFIDRPLLVEFREKLEKLIFDRRIVDIKFHPTAWRYHRDYFLRAKRHEWRRKKSDADVFLTDFFLRDARRSGEIKFDTLSDSEKLNIVIPKLFLSTPVDIIGNSRHRITPMVTSFSINKNLPFQDSIYTLDAKQKSAILKRLNINAARVSEDDSENPFEWFRWGYDIYSLDSSCVLKYGNDGENFEFFFAWRLKLTDLFELTSFLSWHLQNTFDGVKDKLQAFIEIIFIKYKRLSLAKGKRRFIEDAVKNIQIINTHMKVVQDREPESEISADKPSGVLDENQKTVKIPLKVPARTKRPDITSLTSRQTAILFKQLQEAKIITQDTVYMSDQSLASVISVMTGYKGNIYKYLRDDNYDDADLIQTKKELERVILLINSKLSKS